MSRLAIQVSREEVRATAIVEFGPGRPVQFGSDDRVLSEVLKLERPLPLAALVRRVLTRYGLELAEEPGAANKPIDAAPCERKHDPCSA
jgi:hypothetical protein